MSAVMPAVMPSDKVIRCVAGYGALRGFFADSRDMVETARNIHGSSPVATAALGRLLTAACFMGLGIKEDDGSVTLRVKGDGAIGGLLAVGYPDGAVKGYCGNPTADLPTKPNGKLDVSGVIGAGSLTVLKDIGLKEPYVGQIPLTSGEIAEDLTAYFAQSEQTPSVVALGVLIDRDGSVKRAGGFMVQLLPFADDAAIDLLESNIKGITGVTDMFERGMTVEDIMAKVLNGFNIDFQESITPVYRCDCSRERVEKALISLGKKELTALSADGQAELGCQFCSKTYHFSKDELEALIHE